MRKRRYDRYPQLAASAALALLLGAACTSSGDGDTVRSVPPVPPSATAPPIDKDRTACAVSAEVDGHQIDVTMSSQNHSIQGIQARDGFTISFGDGNQERIPGVSTSHTYRAIGSYTIAADMHIDFAAAGKGQELELIVRCTPFTVHLAPGS